MKIFDSHEEQINTILNTNAILIILESKGLITTEEFISAKNDALKSFKKEFPNLFL